MLVAVKCELRELRSGCDICAVVSLPRYAILAAMTKRQKLILVLFGALDLVIIILLGAIALHSQQSLPNLVSQFGPCPSLLLESLPRYLAPTVAWEEERLVVTVTPRYPTSTPPPGSAQLLWTTLDALQRPVAAGCTLPEEIRLVVTARGTATTTGHLARLRGADVTAWLQGELDEEGFAQRGSYYVTRGPKASGSRPDSSRSPR